MKKIITSIILCSALVVGVFALGACGTLQDNTAYAVIAEGRLSSDGFYYDVYENNTAAIRGVEDTSIQQLTIPEKVDGYPVTAIGEKAFRDQEQLLYVKMSGNIKTIGREAFAGCKSLVRADLGGKVHTLETDAFYCCNMLCEVNGTESLQKIGPSSFFQCSSLCFIELGKSVKSIGEQAFFGCVALSALKLPENLTELGDGAFSYCDALSKVELGGLTYVPDNAFEKCVSLAVINIGDNVTSIGENAFRGCEKLSNVTIGKKVSYIASSAFEQTAWMDAQKDEFVIVGDGILLSYKGTATNVVIPSGVKRIADAFCANETIRSVEIGAKVEEIGDFAFSSCPQLSRVTVTGNVKSIGANAFSTCSALTTIYLPASLESVSANAFLNCAGLSNVNYAGTSSAWSKITVEKGNEYLQIATVNYSQKP